MEHNDGVGEDVGRVCVVQHTVRVAVQVVCSKDLHDPVNLLGLSWQVETPQESSEGEGGREGGDEEEEKEGGERRTKEEEGKGSRGRTGERGEEREGEGGERERGGGVRKVIFSLVPC